MIPSPKIKNAREQMDYLVEDFNFCKKQILFLDGLIAQKRKIEEQKKIKLDSSDDEKENFDLVDQIRKKAEMRSLERQKG